jgi:Galactose oxidase, central domain
MQADLPRTPKPHPRRHARRLRLAAAAWLSCAGLLAWSTPSAAAAPLAASNQDTSTPFAGLTWSELSPPTHPPALEGASATYDPADQTIVLFGGRLADGQLSDRTWIWNGSTWSSPPTGSSPLPRASASMAFDGGLDQLILFGGVGSGGTLLDDTWTWNGASWNRVATATTPGGREGAALSSDAEGDFVLFGGYGVTNGRAPSPTTTTTTTTPRRRKHKSSQKSRKAKATRSSTTTSTTDPTTTTSSTEAPSSTTSSTTSTTSTTTPTNGTSGTTTALGADAVDTAALVPGSVSTAAGQSRPTVLDDTWILSRASDGSDQWTQVTNTTATPPARMGAAMSLAADGKTVLFGGTSKAPGASEQRGVLDDTWTWNGHTWSEDNIKRPPAARMDASLNDDTGSEGLGNAVLFGGIGKTTTYADTWLWDGNGWEALKPASAGSVRSAAATAFDAEDGQLLVFGGINSAGKVLDDTEVLTTHAPTHLALPAPKGSSSTTTAGRTGARSPKTPTKTHQPAATSTSIHRGDVITLSGSGFMPHAEVTITFHSHAVLVAKIRADKDGDFTANVNVPPTASLGDHHFEASGMGPKGVIELATPVKVIGVTLVRAVTRWTKLILMGIAIFIPIASWFVVGAIGRHRTRASSV